MSHEMIVVLVCAGSWTLMTIISNLTMQKFVTEMVDIIFKSQTDLQNQINMLVSELYDKNAESSK